ncbi:hypothetical protein [Priestia endophytica]|uniref:hypothetical protein n=1 Tax=Priestia endophytica TaxID=135735 RepID=UPI00228224D0|nr:hypothetical protein [Priestia endophytica]MCY8231048.1 hypothetical protein [Priestia endophytica]
MLFFILLFLLWCFTWTLFYLYRYQTSLKEKKTTVALITFFTTISATFSAIYLCCFHLPLSLYNALVLCFFIGVLTAFVIGRVSGIRMVLLGILTACISSLSLLGIYLSFERRDAGDLFELQLLLSVLLATFALYLLFKNIPLEEGALIKNWLQSPFVAGVVLLIIFYTYEIFHSFFNIKNNSTSMNGSKRK